MTHSHHQNKGAKWAAMARFIRWDRRGDIVTCQFDYTSQDRQLQQRFQWWRLGNGMFLNWKKKYILLS